MNQPTISCEFSKKITSDNLKSHFYLADLKANKNFQLTQENTILKRRVDTLEYQLAELSLERRLLADFAINDPRAFQDPQFRQNIINNVDAYKLTFDYLHAVDQNENKVLKDQIAFLTKKLTIIQNQLAESDAKYTELLSTSTSQESNIPLNQTPNTPRPPRNQTLTQNKETQSLKQEIASLKQQITLLNQELEITKKQLTQSDTKYTGLLNILEKQNPNNNTTNPITPSTNSSSLSKLHYYLGLLLESLRRFAIFSLSAILAYAGYQFLNQFLLQPTQRLILGVILFFGIHHFLNNITQWSYI